MEANGLALALKDNCLGVVEEPLARRPAEERRGAKERAAQRLDAHVEHELGPHRARVREHDDEGPKGTRRAEDDHRTDVGPVDLGHLTGERLDAEERLALGRRARAAHVTA